MVGENRDEDGVVLARMVHACQKELTRVAAVMDTLREEGTIDPEVADEAKQLVELTNLQLRRMADELAVLNETATIEG